MASAAFVAFASALAALFLLGAHLSSRLVREGEARVADSTASGGIDPDRDGPSPNGSGPVGHVDAPGRAAVEADRRSDPAATERDAPPAPGHPADLSAGALFANVFLTHGLLIAALLGAAAVFDVSLPALGVSAAPWVGGAPAVALGLAFGLALWVGNELAAAAADAAGVAYDEALRELLAPETPLGWVVLLGLVLPLVAGAEELLFRAALIGVPAAALGVSPWLLAAVSSAAFALGHGAQGRAGIAVTGALGFVLAAGFVLTGSLLVAVLAHYVVNAMEFVVHEGLGAGRLRLA